MNQLIMMLPPNTAESFQFTDDVVCACCHKPINAFSLFGPKIGPDGINHRMYLGYCSECDKAFEVEQFQNGRWRIHRYKIEDGQWIILQPLPTADSPLPNVEACPPMPSVKPPLIKTGPGGNFTNEISEAELESLLQQATTVQASLGKFLMQLVDIIRAKKRHKHG